MKKIIFWMSLLLIFGMLIFGCVEDTTQLKEDAKEFSEAFASEISSFANSNETYKLIKLEPTLNGKEYGIQLDLTQSKEKSTMIIAIYNSKQVAQASITSGALAAYMLPLDKKASFIDYDGTEVTTLRVAPGLFCPSLEKDGQELVIKRVDCE